MPTAAQHAHSFDALVQQFQRWQQAAAQLQHYQGQQQVRIKQLAAQLVITSDIALQWLAQQQRPLQSSSSGNKTKKTWNLQRQQLQTILNDVDEELLALAQPVELMLECR